VSGAQPPERLPARPHLRRLPPERGATVLSRALLAVLFLLALPAALSAVEYTALPSLSVRGEVNDNILMTAGPHSTVWGSHLSPSLRLRAAMERWRVEGNLWASLSRYAGEKGLDMNEGSLRLSSEYSTESNRWRSVGEVTRDAAWKSELLETGQVLAIQRRTLGMIGGSWNGTMTERVTLLGELEYRQARYSDPESGGLSDYRFYTGTVGSTYSLSERDQLDTNLQLLSYHAPSVGVRSNNVGLKVSWVSFFSETLKGSALIGIRALFTELSAGGVRRRESELGWLAGAMIEKKWERTTLRGDFSRHVDPSGAGYLIEVNRLSGSIERGLTQRTTGALVTHFYWTRPLQGDPPPPGSQSVAIEPSWSWNGAEAWSMRVGYRYLWQRRDQAPRAVDAHSIFLLLTYHGPAWSMSR
jgi:hypothetical protein